MPDDVKIQAQIVSNDVCQFTMDRTLLSKGSAIFSSAEEAKGSPLAEAIFSVPQVVAIVITGTVVKVTKAGDDQWMPIAKQIGASIREQIQSGGALLADIAQRRNENERALQSKAESILNDEINPLIAQHGGHVTLVDVRGSNLYLQLGGGCQGCGMADVTLRQGIETALRRSLPEVDEVLDVTDHAGGKNPFYAPSAK